MMAKELLMCVLSGLITGFVIAIITVIFLAAAINDVANNAVKTLPEQLSNISIQCNEIPGQGKTLIKIGETAFYCSFPQKTEQDLNSDLNLFVGGD
ncbi:MAG TPA: hypothetical protein VMW25_00080 [Clostridia bacterium]|nr:hypothetical protein [Clostridia bacterium]